MCIFDYLGGYRKAHLPAAGLAEELLSTRDPARETRVIHCGEAAGQVERGLGG